MATKRLYEHKDNWLVQWLLDLNWDNFKSKTYLRPSMSKDSQFWKIEIKWSDNEVHIHIA